MISTRRFGSYLILLALGGCADISAPTPAELPLEARFLTIEEPADCDGHSEALRPCTDADEGTGAIRPVFFADWDGGLYEAAGDPSPGSAGIYLGASVTPAACFSAGQGAADPADADRDGLRDNCEFAIARSFAPALWFAYMEGCANGEPYWAAKRFPNGVVRMAYMMGYYKDCGFTSGDDHPGDSEMVSVDVAYNTATQHWETIHLWTSAHYGATQAGMSTDRSEWNHNGTIEYRARDRAYPTVYVALNKHANYPTLRDCNGAADPTGLTSYTEVCDQWMLIRFPVEAQWNAGSRYQDLLGCVPSRKRFSVRTECFYTDTDKFFGWLDSWTGGNYAAATTYHDILWGSNNFEIYKHQDFGVAYPGYYTNF